MEWYWILSIVIGSFLLLFILSILLYKQFFKRFWDIILSLIALITLSPIFLFLILFGSIAMKGNPFFVQKRPGKKNKNGYEKIFSLIKFRTMSNAKDKNGEYLSDDLRLNKYGRFLRSSSLDEIPELINILIGQMSIIGPRPLPVEYLPYYTDDERHRHDVRPGLSGLAQINGRNAISWDEKFKFDLAYVKKISLWSDLVICVRTIIKVFKRENIGQGSERPVSLFEIREEYRNESSK